MTKLVKTDSAVESASREFSARLTKMLGVPEASNVPAVVRPRPMGKLASQLSGDRRCQDWYTGPRTGVNFRCTKQIGHDDAHAHPSIGEWYA